MSLSPDRWTRRMDLRWRDSAPRIESLDDKGDYILTGVKAES